jgi:hypothetical protein
LGLLPVKASLNFIEICENPGAELIAKKRVKTALNALGKAAKFGVGTPPLWTEEEIAITYIVNYTFWGGIL